MKAKFSIQACSALLLLISGVVLSFLGFYTAPEGEISDSVLWYFSQTLIYAGSIFGVSTYVRSKFKDIEIELKQKDK